MIYRLCNGNHEQTGAIEETLTWLQQLLATDGQRVQRGELPYGRIAGDYMNVVVENFTGEKGSFFATAHTGGDWICVCTELLGNWHFNEHDVDDQAYWLQRFDAFRTAAEQAAELWLAVHDPESVAGYRALFPGKTVRVLPFPKLYGATASTDERLIDVLHIGRVTVYRKYVLDTLKRAGLRVIALPEATPGMLRDQAIDQAKVLLSLPEAALIPRKSSVPVWYGLQRGACVVAQESPGDPLHAVVLPTPPDRIVEWCASLAQHGWQIIQKNQQERFALQTVQPLGLPTFSQLVQNTPRNVTFSAPYIEPTCDFTTDGGTYGNA